MKGQRGAVGSMPEILSFGHGSASSSVKDEQISWNYIQNHAENRLPDYPPSPTDADISYVHTVGHERHNRSGWTMGETSSSNALNEVSRDEQKHECGWSSSVGACDSIGPRSEERRYEPNNVLPVEIMPSSIASTLPPNLILNAAFVGHGGDSQVTECPNLYKANGLGNQIISPPCASDPFLVSSGNGGYLVEENDGRPGCSLDPCRSSRKRKVLEENVGQTSLSGSYSFFPRAESGTLPVVPPFCNASSSLNISASSEQLNRRLGLGVRGVASDNLSELSMVGSAVNSHRNIRVRMNSSNQQGSSPSNLFSTGSALRHHSVSSSDHSSRLPSVGHSLDFRTAPVTCNMIPQNQSAIVHVPTLPQNEQTFRWAVASSSRTGGSSSTVIPGERDVRHEIARSRMSGHPVVIPATESRSLAQNPTINSSSGGNTNILGDVGSGSTSRASSNLGLHPSSAPTWVPHGNPSRYPRRLSDYVRRSLFSSSGPEPGGPSSNYSPSRSGSPVSFQEMENSSGANYQGHQRQGGGVHGMPYPMRTLATTGDGRRRFVSEQIQNALDYMRRGEGLRLEDVMILEQSVFYGVAGFHDRHRDMRLDVDNMSYEELLALEERIGNVCTGLTEENILTRLKQQKYSTIVARDQLKAEPCCICQEEYNDGEDLGTLQCGHDFHANCIKQWLMHKNLCPICKTTGLIT